MILERSGSRSSRGRGNKKIAPGGGTVVSLAESAAVPVTMQVAAVVKSPGLFDRTQRVYTGGKGSFIELTVLNGS
jgi:hypothetical protein